MYATGNHPLLFGTVSPTTGHRPLTWPARPVTTPYCSGLSLLPGLATGFAVTAVS